MKIKFITLETSPDPLEKNCVQSGRMNNIDIEVLGRGYEWQGFVTKFHILKDYISNIKEKYVCFTDARDVIYLGNNEQIWNTYKKHYLDKLVLNAEINCFPDISFVNEWPCSKEYHFRYLNSGCFIGPVDLISKVIDECLSFHDKHKTTNQRRTFPFSKHLLINDDQYIFYNIFVNGINNDKITLDNNCHIFQTLHLTNKGEEIDYKETYIHNNVTKTNPLIIHGNSHNDLYPTAKVLCNRFNINPKEVFNLHDLIHSKHIDHLL